MLRIRKMYSFLFGAIEYLDNISEVLNGMLTREYI